MLLSFELCSSHHLSKLIHVNNFVQFCKTDFRHEILCAENDSSYKYKILPHENYYIDQDKQRRKSKQEC